MNTSYLYAFMASIFWGVGFIGSRFGLEEFGPLWISCLRFIIATLVMLPVFLRSSLKFKELARDIKGAFICSLFLSGVICFQIAGLEFTTIAKSGFITILYAFFTPILYLILYKKQIATSYWILLSIAFMGMLMLCELNFDSFNLGDLLTLMCALFSAFHILAISKYAKAKNFFVFNLQQMIFVSIICSVFAIIFEGMPSSLIDGTAFMNSKAIIGLLFMGVFSTSIAFALQIKAQEKISEHIASLIFLLESPIAAFLGFIIFAEKMSVLAVSGCTLVIISVGMIPLIKNIKFEVNFLIRVKELFLRPVTFLFAISLIVIIYF